MFFNIHVYLIYCMYTKKFHYYSVSIKCKGRCTFVFNIRNLSWEQYFIEMSIFLQKWSYYIFPLSKTCCCRVEAPDKPWQCYCTGRFCDISGVNSQDDTHLTANCSAILICGNKTTQWLFSIRSFVKLVVDLPAGF